MLEQFLNQVSQSGMKDQSGMNPRLLIGQGKNWFRASSSKLRVIENIHHRLYFLPLAMRRFLCGGRICIETDW